MKKCNEMKVKEAVSVKVFRAGNTLLLSFLALLCLYPFWHVCMASFSDSALLARNLGLLLRPAGFSTEAYRIVLKEKTLYTGFFNTILLLVIGIPLNMLLTCMGAYFFSRKNVYFKKPLFLLCLLTMYLHGGTIPFYLTLKDLHLTGSLWGVILSAALSTYNMIVMKTAFEAIPDSLSDAARIDGAGHLTILFKIVLPLSRATFAVIAMYYGMSIWNSWFWASTILQDESSLPLQSVLRNFLIEDAGNEVLGVAVKETVKYATIMVSIIPVLFIYPFMQKYFAKGVLVGGVKE